MGRLETAFSLEDYVTRIKLTDKVKNKLDYLTKELVDYIERISKLSEDEIKYFLIDYLYRELNYSNKIENAKNGIKIGIDNFEFDSLEVTEDRINELHRFVLQEDVDLERKLGYRPKNVDVAGIEDGESKVYYEAPSSAIVKELMDQFYNLQGSSFHEELKSGLIKPTLMHLIFVKIHPFIDGNGRTSRLIHNMEFTTSVNGFFNKKFKLCPLCISPSIYINKVTYAKTLNGIEFSGTTDDNEGINKFIDFILNMYSEQLYFMSTHLDKHERILHR